MASKLTFLNARLEAFKRVLDGKSSAEKDKNVADVIVNEFNSIVKDIAKEFPSAADHLPREVTSHSRMLIGTGMSDIHYIDLEILVEQVRSIVSILKTEE
jgi:hypothetical protein